MKSKTERSGYEECVGVSRLLLESIGVWPQSHGKGNFFKRNYVFVTPTVIFFILIVPQFRKLLFVWRDLNAVVDILSIGLMIVIICFVKFLRIWHNYADFNLIMESIHDDWERSTVEEQRVMWRNARYSRLIVTVSFTSVVINCILLALFVFVQYHFELKDLPANVTIPRPTVMNTDYYIDLHWTPIWEILNVIQFYAIIIASAIYSGYDGVFVLSTLHYSAQFYNLQQKVEVLVDESLKNQRSFVSVLIPVIDRHEYLCRYTALIEKNFNMGFLIQIFITALHLCLQSYQFVSVASKHGLEELPKLLFTIFYVSTSLFSLFIYCFISEQLRIHSENVFVSVFKMKWYELAPHESRLLIMIMIRTEKPINITAGKFHVLSLEYFCSVLKSCASFFSLLLAMRDKVMHD